MVNISQYVERLERLKANKQSTLTPDELKEIIRELGWTEEELAEVEAQARTHLERGNNFFRRELWQEAIKEYREAHALAPIDVAVAGQLAIACLQIWRKSRTSANHHQAEYYARLALDLDSSYQPAYEVLSELNSKGIKADPNGIRVLVFLSAGVVFLLGFVVVLISLRPSPAQPKVKFERIEVPVSTVSGSTDPGDIPVEFQTVQNLKLKLIPRYTEQSNYATSSFFKYGWLLENQSDKEIRVLKGKIELMDDSGKVLQRVEARILDSHQGKLRPGDSKGFSSTVPSDPNVVKARLVLESAETMPAASKYDAGEKIEVVWDVKKPSSAEITIREREQHTDKVSKDKVFAFFRGTWEVTNTGEQPFEMLRIKIALLGADGNEVDSSGPYVVSVSDPYLAAGESRIVATTQSIKEAVTGYRIHVSEFR